jgi:hypothetical protein
MSVEQEKSITQRVLVAGIEGIKKSDLRKEFSAVDMDNILEHLVVSGNVCIEKRGQAYYCWHREHYLEKLLKSDPRFRLSYEIVRSLEHSINKTSDSLAISMEKISENISNFLKENKTITKEVWEDQDNSDDHDSHILTNRQVVIMQLDQFKNVFDELLSKNSDSLRWMELARIRAELCEHFAITSDQFYNLVEQLTIQYPDKYELSSGGQEGLTLRGLIHGLVRYIQ